MQPDFPTSEPGSPRRAPSTAPDLVATADESSRPLTRRELRERAALLTAALVTESLSTPMADAAEAARDDVDADAPVVQAEPEAALPDAALPAPEAALPEAQAAEPEAEAAEPEAAASQSARPAPRARRVVRPASAIRSAGRRVATGAFSIGVMGCVGLLALATAAPAEAVAAAVSTEPLGSIQVSGEEKAAEYGEIQAYVAPANVDLSIDRSTDTYSVESFSQIAASTGITNHTNFFVNDSSGEIQWPFAVGVPISWGFGPRWGGMHSGLDFTPGDGAEIQAVAAGTVRIADEAGGDFGVHVMIDHVIDGEVFTSHYAHMQYGSLKVTQGQKVEAGDLLGLVGNTGLSFGAHMHFEIYINEVRIDPLPWLRQHAGG